jgi:hypothetical protein
MIVRYLLLILVIYVFVAGCMPPDPVATIDLSGRCEEIIHPALLNVPFDELALGREQAEEWILTQFPTATVQTTSSSESGITENSFYWSEGDKGFALVLLQKAKYLSQTSKQYPTLGAILHCYGDPMYYTLEPNVPIGPGTFGYLFDIYYPNNGFRFRGSTWEATVAQRYDATSVMNGDIIVMPIGAIEEIIPNVSSTEDHGQIIRSLLQEWPDDFTEIVLEE